MILNRTNTLLTINHFTETIHHYHKQARPNDKLMSGPNTAYLEKRYLLPFNIIKFKLYRHHP